MENYWLDYNSILKCIQKSNPKSEKLGFKLKLANLEYVKRKVIELSNTFKKIILAKQILRNYTKLVILTTSDKNYFTKMSESWSENEMAGWLAQKVDEKRQSKSAIEEFINKQKS